MAREPSRLPQAYGDWRGWPRQPASPAPALCGTAGPQPRPWAEPKKARTRERGGEWPPVEAP